MLFALFFITVYLILLLLLLLLLLVLSICFCFVLLKQYTSMEKCSKQLFYIISSGVFFLQYLDQSVSNRNVSG